MKKNRLLWACVFSVLSLNAGADDKKKDSFSAQPTNFAIGHATAGNTCNSLGDVASSEIGEFLVCEKISNQSKWKKIGGGSGLGDGQKYYNFNAASRAKGATYTNNTGKPILVKVGLKGNAVFFVNGSPVASSKCTNQAMILTCTNTAFERIMLVGETYGIDRYGDYSYRQELR